MGISPSLNQGQLLWRHSHTTDMGNLNQYVDVVLHDICAYGCLWRPRSLEARTYDDGLNSFRSVDLRDSYVISTSCVSSHELLFGTRT